MEKRVKSFVYCILALLVASSAGVLTAEPAHAATFIVNSTADGGDNNPGNGECFTGSFVPGDGITLDRQCTLRAAIQEANANNNGATVVDAINFNIRGTGVKTISPASILPTIAEPVTIDGYTQRPCSTNPAPCSKQNSSAVGTNAVLLVELNGENIPTCDCGGLQITASNSVVKGLVINRFSSGIYMFPSATSTPTGNRIMGNFIGTDSSGTTDRGNLFDGVAILGSSNTVGGTARAARNLISGNNQDGIHARRSGNQVLGNLIGTDRTGTKALGNDANGVVIDLVEQGLNNPILGNSIFSNAELGIDLGISGVTANDTGDVDTGPNNLQNYPVLSSAVVSGTTTRVQGFLNSEANKTYTLQFFSSPQADPSGFGEGRTFLGQRTDVTTNSSGNAFFSFSAASAVRAGHAVTATATDPSGNTSEFSEAVGAVNTSPTITNLKPSPGSITRDRTPRIAATVQDAQTNLAKSNIKLFVDGKRKRVFAYNASTDRLFYPSELVSFGRHTVKIVATDRVLSTTKSWRFKVVRG